MTGCGWNKKTLLIMFQYKIQRSPNWSVLGGIEPRDKLTISLDLTKCVCVSRCSGAGLNHRGGPTRWTRLLELEAGVEDHLETSPRCVDGMMGVKLDAALEPGGEHSG